MPVPKGSIRSKPQVQHSLPHTGSPAGLHAVEGTRADKGTAVSDVVDDAIVENASLDLRVLAASGVIGGGRKRGSELVMRASAGGSSGGRREDGMLDRPVLTVDIPA